MQRKVSRKGKNIAIFSIGAVLYLLIFIFSAEATFYEVRGKILWEKKDCKGVNAYLLYDELPAGNLTPEAEISKAVPKKTFSEAYAILEKEKRDTDILSDEKAAKKALKKLMNDLKGFIKAYKERNIIVSSKGEFYLNVSPSMSYYVLVVKKGAFLTVDNHTRFWLEKIYFKPGDVLDAKELILNESNVITW